MNKEENKILPQLRFPEFVNNGDWEENELGKICDVRDGTHDSPKYVSGGYPLITSKNLLENGEMDFENVTYLTQVDYDKINKRSKVDVGDILFGMIGTIGNPVLVKRDGFAIKNVALIKTKGLLEQEYLIQLLKSNYIDIQFKKANAGGILKFIALGMIRKLIIPTPKKEEQQKIANCLSSLDDVINAESEKLDLLQDHKKGLLQQLFPQQGESQPKYRFPEFVDDVGWEKMTLNDVCDVTNGKSNAQDHVENGKYPLFDRSEVIKASDKFLFDCEAVILPGEGMRFIPKYYKGKFDLHQRAYALKNFKYVGNYIYYYMLDNSALLASKAVRSTVLSLRLPIIQKFPILLPVGEKGILEQQKIAKCLSSVDELIASQQQKIEGLKAHKKGLLQKLFPTIKN